MSKSAAMNCVKCGNNNPTTSKFCNNCGSKLESSCPQCGYVFPEGSKFCNSCGSKLSSDNNRPHPAESTETSILPDVIKENDIEFDLCELFEYGIKISYPTGWTKYDHGLDLPLVAAFASPKESATDPFFDSVGITVQKVVPRFATLDNVVKLNIDDLKVSNSDFVLDETSKTTLSNEPAYKLVYRDGGFKTLSVLTIRQISDPGDLIIVIYRALPSSYNKFLPIANKMIESFEFMH